MDMIKRARAGFEASFAEGNFYNQQTQDDEHLSCIQNLLPIENGNKVLDLGTGSGYLSFAIAKKYPKAVIIGLDIVTKTLEQNRISALEQGITNLEFIDYDGMTLPFECSTFDLITSRYALHHFPHLQDSFNEMTRVLKPNGWLFISDPKPHDFDADRFVDSYMQLQDDGHNTFRFLNDFISLASTMGMKLKDSFMSSIRFPRKINNSYFDLLQNTDENIKQLYEIEIIGDECYISLDVLNTLFQKTS